MHFEGVDLTNATLANSILVRAYFDSANLTGCDMRGAQGFEGPSAITQNTILVNGTVQGLRLDKDNPQLTVRNFKNLEGQPPIPIHIQQGMQLEADSVIQFVLDDEPWNSTISFDAGIPVTLGGKLLLDIDTPDPSSLIGTTFDLFDWSGVDPTGQFEIVSGDVWDTSRLYRDGTVTLISVPEPATVILIVSLLLLWGVSVTGRTLGSRTN